MKPLGEYLYKKVKVICTDGKVFTGQVDSFGGSVQAKEEYGRSEEYIDIYAGDSCYVLFQSEIKEIIEL